MKYYIIAGEPSGDMHAANLLQAIRHNDPDCEFRAWGGDKMAAAGATIVKHIRDLAFMGFVEVLLNLRKILSNLKFCKNDILSYAPDVLILVDYPGFNLRIAEFAHENNIKVFYYISPQVWAWKKQRVKKIRRAVDEMFVILPFEQEFYQQHNVDVFFGGHPLMDEVKNYRDNDNSLHLSKPEKTIALLPGSRKQEIKRILPVMAAAAQEYSDYSFVIAGVKGHTALYKKFIAGNKNISIIYGQTYALLNSVTAAVVTSGTATLETAIFNVPQVVCYSGSPISVFIARNLIKVKYISLVNLILDKAAVKELIQSDLTKKHLVSEIRKLLPGSENRDAIISDYNILNIKLGDAGASNRTAKKMVELLK